MTDVLITITVLFILFLGLASLLSTVYLFRLYREFPEPRSWFMFALLRMNAVESVIGAYFAYLAAARLANSKGGGLPLLPADLNLLIFAVAVVILLSPPVYYALVIYRRRR